VNKAILLSILICATAFAQRGGQSHGGGGRPATVGGGHVPAHGPPAARASAPTRGRQDNAATENHVKSG
jgi:hypothetical protein